MTMPPPPATNASIPSYCYNCVSGPDFMTVKVIDGVATEIEPNFAAAEVHPARGKPCVKAYGLVQKTYNPHRILHADEAHQPEEGARRGSGLRADLLGRGARHRRRPLKAVREKGLLDEAGPAARGGQLRPRRHAGHVHGHPARPSSPPGGRSTSASAPARASSACTPSTSTASSGTAPSPSPPTRPTAATTSRSAPTSTSPAARARSPATPTRASAATSACRSSPTCRSPAPVVRVGADPPQDRPRLHVRADPRAGVRARAGEARHALPARPHRPRPTWSAPTASTCATPTARKPLVWDENTAGRAVPFDTPARARARRPLPRRRGGDRGCRRRAACAQRRRGQAPPTRCWSSTCAKYTPEWAEGICDVPAATIRRIAGEYLETPAGRRHHRDRRRHPAAAPGGGHARQVGEQRLGRLRVLLGAHGAGHAGGRARGAGRHPRHHGAAEQARTTTATSASPPARTASWRRNSTPPTRSTGSPGPPAATPTAPWCRSSATRHGARRSAPPSWRGCSSARCRATSTCPSRPCPTSGSSTAPTRRSRSGTRPAWWRRSPPSPSPCPSPTRWTRPTSSPTCCCPRPPTSNPCR
jgi:hypothetical protein